MLFGLAQGFLARGEKQKAHEIALRIIDSDMAQSAETAPSAWNDAEAGHSADAYKDIESGECD